VTDDWPGTFPPETLRQYALVADGERGGLIGPRGDIAFRCFPRWHDPAVFSSLIGGTGHYAVTPAAPRFVWGGHYEPGSLVWRSRWVAGASVIECREALALPADEHRLVLLRRIEALHGDARVRVVLDPRAEFGRRRCLLRRVSESTWAGDDGGLRLRWQGGDDTFRRVDGGLVGELCVPAGRHHDLVLELTVGSLASRPPSAARLWAATEAEWRRAQPHLAPSLADEEVRHSYAVLRGLTSRAGGMVAAVTTSLPERAATGRNYDYRYAWVRDQCYAGHAAAVAGADPLLDSAVHFVSERVLEDGPRLKPAYTVAGGPVPEESTLDLPGYPGGSDRVGNRVNRQFQLDSLGEALLLFAAAARAGRLGDDAHQASRVAARVIRHRWREPDAGIWELDNEHWTHSKLMCAAGLRDYARAVPGPDTADWEPFAEHIVDETSRRSLHASGRWQRTPDDERVDASLLLPALRGAVDPEDPRSLGTLRAVRDELADDGYVFRFRQGPGRPNDYEGAFLLCGFHLALALHQVGDELGAARWFERNRAAVGPPGLFTEEFDVVERQQRGNLPQAFVHALLMETAVTLAREADEPHTSPAYALAAPAVSREETW
jgi:alpha,alpha-trehalase